MKLITENIEEVQFVLEEDKKTGQKKPLIEGIFMQAEQRNRNGRIYPKAVLEGAVKRYMSEQVARNRAVGELNHPDGPTINLDKVSHRITELSWDGNNVMGKALLLDTPMGRIARGLMEGGVQLGVSSRGMGSLEQRNGVSYVKPDFMLATVDIVQDPSAPDAFVNGIMEGAEFIYDAVSDSWIKQELIENLAKKTKSKQINEDQAIRELKNILFNINT